MGKTISAEIIADSKDDRGNRITSYILTYPRFIHGEIMTHRMFSRNAASSRAIPFAKMVKDIEEDPFIPIAWQKDHKGMQGAEYFTDKVDVDELVDSWQVASYASICRAKELNEYGVTKQLCNRLLEPFQWMTTLVTATEYDNFFELRCPKYIAGVPGEGYEAKSWKELLSWHSNEENLEKLKSMTLIERLQNNNSQAEIHIQALAEAMWDAKNENTPVKLSAGEWHIPFGDKILDESGVYNEVDYNKAIKIATARCARLSYMTFDGKIDYKKDTKLHDQLLEAMHMSPFEHCAKVMTDLEYYEFHAGKAVVDEEDGLFCYDFHSVDDYGQIGWCKNYKGFIQYRHIVENE